MLIPNHASVGSGRKPVSPFKSLKAPIALDFSELSRINENLTFEEDDEDEVPESPTKRPRNRSVFSTPGKQIITDEQVESWHGKSFNNFSSDDEECVSSPLVNPFLAPSSAKPKPLVLDIDYSTHIEYINHRTGERKVEALLASQQRFKPKKIDFSGI